jgi:hypothetical protein
LKKEKRCKAKRYIIPSTEEVLPQQLRERMDKWDYMKLKIFCRAKEMVCKLKRPPIE